MVVVLHGGRRFLIVRDCTLEGLDFEALTMKSKMKLRPFSSLVVGCREYGWLHDVGSTPSVMLGIHGRCAE